MLKKIFIIPFTVCFINSISVQASILDQVVYSVVGQVGNALGSRLGDEIYYGSSKKTHKRKSRKKRKRKKKTPIPVSVSLSPEMKIQKSLASLGFYRGKIDGLINSYETRSAIKAMNIAYNISNTSSLNPSIKDSLLYLHTLFIFDTCLVSQKSDKKSKGKKIQTSLKIHGFYFTEIDGLIGKGTRRCISDYKKAKGFQNHTTLDFEEEYLLISTATELNNKNIEEAINLLKIKHLGQNNQMNQNQMQNSQYNRQMNQNQGQMNQNQMQNQQYNRQMNQNQMQNPQYNRQTNQNQGQMNQNQMQNPQYNRQTNQSQGQVNQNQMQPPQYNRQTNQNQGQVNQNQMQPPQYNRQMNQSQGQVNQNQIQKPQYNRQISQNQVIQNQNQVNTTPVQNSQSDEQVIASDKKIEKSITDTETIQETVK